MISFTLLRAFVWHKAAFFRVAALYTGIVTPVTTKGAIHFKGGHFYADISLEEKYTTNANASKDAKEDFITTVSPSISYKAEEATLEWQSTAAVNFIRYYKLLENNSDNIRLFLNVSYPNGISIPYSFTANLSATESTKSDSEFGEIIRDRNYNALINSNYVVSTLYSIGIGIDYSLTKPLSGDRNETSSRSLPFTVNYNYSKLLSYGIGYRIRKEDSSGNELEDISSVDHALFCIVDGQFFPLIKGSLELGIQSRQLDKGESKKSELQPYANVNLIWQASTLTTCNFSLSSDFQMTTISQTSRIYQINVDLSHEFGANLAGKLLVSLGQKKSSTNASKLTETRNESKWSFGTGLYTKYGQATNLTINMEYTQNDSSEDRNTYNELALAFKITHEF